MLQEWDAILKKTPVFALYSENTRGPENSLTGRLLQKFIATSSGWAYDY